MLKYTAARDAHSISPRLLPASDTRPHTHTDNTPSVGKQGPGPSTLQPAPTLLERRRDSAHHRNSTMRSPPPPRHLTSGEDGGAIEAVGVACPLHVLGAEGPHLADVAHHLQRQAVLTTYCRTLPTTGTATDKARKAVQVSKGELYRHSTTAARTGTVWIWRRRILLGGANMPVPQDNQTLPLFDPSPD